MNRAFGIFVFILLLTSLFTAEAATKIIIYQAYTQNNVLNPNLVIAQRYTGNCWMKSLANPSRNDAWRCQASNLILDPCFEDSTSLACVVSPWSHKVAVLELNQPLYQRATVKLDPNTAQPWGFELEKGQRCTFLTGTSTIVNNVRVNYSCEPDSYSILGNIDRSTPTWKVDLYNYHDKSIVKADIVTAWF